MINYLAISDGNILFRISLPKLGMETEISLLFLGNRRIKRGFRSDSIEAWAEALGCIDIRIYQVAGQDKEERKVIDLIDVVGVALGRVVVLRCHTCFDH